MKIRKGFVSNSSSSSFMISSNESNPELTLTLKFKIDDLCSHIITSEKDLLKYFDDVLCMEKEEIFEYEEWRRFYTKTINEIKDGKTVYVCKVSSDDCYGIQNVIYTHNLMDKLEGNINFLGEI